MRIVNGLILHGTPAGQLPDYMRFTPAQQAQFDQVVAQAKVRHEKARKAAKARGRHSFPDSPFEGSWVHQLQWFRENCQDNLRDETDRPRRAGSPNSMADVKTIMEAEYQAMMSR